MIFLNHSLASECQKKVLPKNARRGMCGFWLFLSSKQYNVLVVLLEVLIPVRG